MYDKKKCIYMCVCVWVCIYIYIYIYIEGVQKMYSRFDSQSLWNKVTCSYILVRYCSVMFAHVCTYERFYLQQDGAPPHYHRNVRVYLDDTLPRRWIGRRGAIEYPLRSPFLTPLYFYLWGTLKDEVYRHWTCYEKPSKRHVQPSHQTRWQP
jgi:hypothetical protein